MDEVWTHEFPHGLGDTVQLGLVIRHLRHYRPDVTTHRVVCRPGCGGALRGIADEIYLEGGTPPPADADMTVQHHWSSPWRLYGDAPSTKAVCCLREILHLEPIDSLLHYRMTVRLEAQHLARAAVEAFGPFVTIHYQGNTAMEAKDLPHDVVRAFCHRMHDEGLGVILFDWDDRSTLPYEKLVWCMDGRHGLWNHPEYDRAEMIGAVMAKSRCNVCIDSGPGKIAAAVAGTGWPPCLTVWHQHHPVNFLDLADNTYHLVSANHRKHLQGMDPKEPALEYFASHYPHTHYGSQGEMTSMIGDQAAALAWRRKFPAPRSEWVFDHGHWLRRDMATQDDCIAQDVYVNDCYRVAAINFKPQYVVDVGACIGSYALKMHERFPDARILCVECCPENIPTLMRNVGTFARVVEAALTYEKDVGLLNAVYPGCASTGGSAVVSRRDLQTWHDAGPERQPGLSLPGGSPIAYKDGHKREYWADYRDMATVTLEELCERYNFPCVDILKLDCEGSEFSILANMQMGNRIRTVVGEWHAPEPDFRDFVARRLRGWRLEVWRGGFYGMFQLSNHSSIGFHQP